MRLTPLPDETTFSMNETFAPVAWSAGRWPHEDWIDGAFWWIGREGQRPVWRKVAATTHANMVSISGTGAPELDAAWLARICKPMPPSFCLRTDPVIARIQQRHPGAWAFCYGSLFDGVLTSIVGQSISLAAAGITAGRLARLFETEIPLAGHTFVPLPTWDQLAAADPVFIRQSGVTTKRAEALVAVGRLFASGVIAEPTDEATIQNAVNQLLDISGIGPWTVASSLLWGIGAPDAFPHGDVALLRAARGGYHRETMDMRDLERLAETWRPCRGEASRLLWLNLFGAAR